MLKAKLFKGFAILVIIFGVLSAFFAIRMIETRVVAEAQRRVQFDMSSAWFVYNSKLQEIQTILKLAASKTAVLETAEKQDWTRQDIRNRLEVIRINLKLDFLGVISPERQVVLRTTPPYKTGDYRPISETFVTDALQGKAFTTTVLFNKEDLVNESEALAERAFVVIEQTPRSMLTQKIAEDRGMVMLGAAPIQKGNQVLGVIYGGVLLNRNHALVDHMKDIIYKKEMYESTPVGTATIFLHGTRIATTVNLPNGNRALGTRVSKEVGDRVLEGNGAWFGRAFVVNDWYLTAYDPIYNYQGEIIGMLYVGLLEKPFQALGQTILMRYIWLLGIGLILSLILSFWLADRLARPILRLEEATNQMRQGINPVPIPIDKASQETQNLIIAFNEMAQALAEREAHLKEANEKLAQANETLTATNRSYMETLGFVSHELKTPVATIMNYVFLLKEEKIGPLTEKQQKAIKNIDNNVKHLVEMIRHYLNLSRIENGVLQPVKTKVSLLTDILNSILETFEPDLLARKMILENLIQEEVVIFCDLNMTREVFENLISNAIKYGREQGKLRISSRNVQDFVEFSVANEGDGIPPDKINTIFQKFSRLEDQQATRRQKGTGLGLFITKHIVEAHGGTIQVTSEPNQWTEFRFTLPCYKEKN